VGLVYDPSGTVRSNDRQTRSGWGVTPMIRLGFLWTSIVYSSTRKLFFFLVWKLQWQVRLVLFLHCITL
jgi:hypothetical protein